MTGGRLSDNLMVAIEREVEMNNSRLLKWITVSVLVMIALAGGTLAIEARAEQGRNANLRHFQANLIAEDDYARLKDQVVSVSSLDSADLQRRHAANLIADDDYARLKDQVASVSHLESADLQRRFAANLIAQDDYARLTDQVRGAGER